jgi:hypothetical protein
MKKIEEKMKKSEERREKRRKRRWGWRRGKEIEERNKDEIDQPIKARNRVIGESWRERVREGERWREKNRKLRDMRNDMRDERDGEREKNAIQRTERQYCTKQYKYTSQGKRNRKGTRNSTIHESAASDLMEILRFVGVDNWLVEERGERI